MLVQRNESMHGRTEKMKKVFASVFLLGYLSFVMLSITHFHNPDSVNSGKTVLSVKTSVSKALSDSEDNCQICHLYSSVNFFSPALIISNILKFESPVNTIDQIGYQSEFFKSLSLRAPPSLV